MRRPQTITSYGSQSPALCQAARAALAALISVALGAAVGGCPKRSAPADNRDDVCPPSRDIEGDDPDSHQNKAVAGLGTAVLVGAIPERAGDWTRARASGIAAGMAGHWADSAVGVLEHGPVRADIALYDMIRACTCVSGTGSIMLAQEGREDEGSRVETTIAGHPAVLKGKGPRSLAVWLADRCLVTVTAPSDSEVMSAASVLGLAALDDACRKR